MLALREKLNSFNERLYRIESHTDRSVRVLADIDRAKTRMEDCLKALEQVDKLSKLTADIEAVFATNDYKRVRPLAPSSTIICQALTVSLRVGGGEDRIDATLCLYSARRGGVPRLGRATVAVARSLGNDGGPAY